MTTQILLPYVLALIINDKNEILLQHRENTGIFDNFYGLIGGKVENHEPASQALIRELKEEINIEISSDHTELAHVMHFIGQTKPCLGLFFKINQWQGQPTNMEHHKHDHIKWFALDNLPSNIIPRHKMALYKISQGINYSEDNF